VIFLKLGGSLLTVKEQPETPRKDVLNQAAAEIAEFLTVGQARGLLVGHGSGSFGHSAAAEYGTQQGASTAEQWRGAAAVWRAAARLNRMLMEVLSEAGVPAISLPPSASAISVGGQLVELAVEPVERALNAGLVPVVQGDVVFDRRLGVAIVSTEQVLLLLAQHLQPDRILLAGLEAGVYADYPARQRLMAEVKPDDLRRAQLAGAEAADVTGGMAGKVELALDMARLPHRPVVRIFSGDQPGALRQALAGEPLGSLVLAS
jgi:isopentenyl phosphate kinase